MVAAAGYSTGLYTSPHLQEVRERIRIDGRALSEAMFEEALFAVVGTAKSKLRTLPTYFETLTAAAFKVFADEEVDLAIIEVGLGGRLDATNVANPLLSLITEVGLEHQEFLGSNFSSIAREKAGILRPDIPAFAWTDREEVWGAIRQVAEDLGANLARAQERVKVSWVGPTGGGQQAMRLSTSRGDTTIATGLLGRHQAANVGLAILGAEELLRGGFSRLDRQAIVQGVATCRWPGRLERIDISGKRPVLLDAAHNPDGAESLFRYLQDADASYDLLFGSLADKDVGSYLPKLAASAERVFLTTPPNYKALATSALKSFVTNEHVVIEENATEALRLALREQNRENLLVVCGSIYLVGEIRSRLRKDFGQPPSAGSIALFGGADQSSG
jgi:dihydrofolate synthase/folylpolyglutamate synthase